MMGPWPSPSPVGLTWGSAAPQMEPMGPQMGPQGPQREPKGSTGVPKGILGRPKGSIGDADAPTQGH